MSYNIFNIEKQHKDVSSKIVAGLERISEAFRVLLWQHAKVEGLSPIQIQLLIFVAYHSESLCNVSHLAKEFNMTKATISDAVRVLNKKELIQKVSDAVDKRAYSIQLTSKGKSIVQNTEHFADPIFENLKNLSEKEQEELQQHLFKLIYGLNKAGILSVQRTCFACRFYEKRGKGHYCNYMQSALLDKNLRLDCEEFQTKS